MALFVTRKHVFSCQKQRSSTWFGIIWLTFCYLTSSTCATIVISSDVNPDVSGLYVRGVKEDHETAFAKAASSETANSRERLDLWLYSFDLGMGGARWLVGPDIHRDSALTFVDTWSLLNPCTTQTKNGSTRQDPPWMIFLDGEWQPDTTLTIECHGLELGGVEACSSETSSSNKSSQMVPCIDLVGAGDGHPVQMPLVMLGTAYISASHGAGAQNPEVVEPAPAIELALDNNYQGLDLGSQLHPAYANERQVGELLAQRPGRRKSIFLTTKLSPNEHGYQSTIQAVQRSLQLLRTDTIDLFLIHHPKCLMSEHCEGDWVDSWRAMERLLGLGAVRAIGVSNFDYRLLHHLVGGDGHAFAGVARAPVSLLQNRADPLALEDTSVLRLCRAHNINYQSFSVLGRQWTVGPWSEYWKASAHPILGHPHVAAIADRLSHETSKGRSSKKTAKATTVAPAQVILRWAIQKGWSVVPKTAKADRLESNRQLFHFDLTDLDMEIIDNLKAPPRPDPQEL